MGPVGREDRWHRHTTYALQARVLDLAVQLGPHEVVVASNTVTLERLSGLASESGDIRAVVLLHGGAQKGSQVESQSPLPAASSPLIPDDLVAHSFV